MVFQLKCTLWYNLSMQLGLFFEDAALIWCAHKRSVPNKCAIALSCIKWLNLRVLKTKVFQLHPITIPCLTSTGQPKQKCHDMPRPTFTSIRSKLTVSPGRFWTSPIGLADEFHVFFPTWNWPKFQSPQGFGACCHDLFRSHFRVLGIETNRVVQAWLFFGWLLVCYVAMPHTFGCR